MGAFDLTLILILNLIWSTAFAFSGYAMNFFAPIFLYGARFLFAGLISLPFSKFPRKDIGKIFVLSLLQSFCFYGIALGIKNIDSSTSAIMSRLDVIFSIFLGVYFLKEKVFWNTFLGIFLCFIAIFVMYHDIHINNIGYLLLLILSAVFSSLANVLIKYIKNTKPMDITIWSSILIGLELLFVSHLIEPEGIIQTPNIKSVAVFLYLSLISTYLGYCLLYYILKKYDISKIMPYNFIRPVISLFAGYIILQESITPAKIIGVILINIGIYVSQRKFEKK